MDQITQWKTACREIAAFKTGDRIGQAGAYWQGHGLDLADLPPISSDQAPTFRRYLAAEAEWNDKWANPAQPEKVLDYVGGWRTFPNSFRNGVTINRLALRGADCLRTKLADATRLLCIGDSCVFGANPDDAAWPAQLQMELNLISPPEYQVLNAGVNGQSSLNVYLRLPQLLKALEPDTVLIAVLANDAWSCDPGHERDLAAFVPEGFVRNVQFAVDICRAHGAEPIIVTPPGMVPTDLKMTAAMLLAFHQAAFLGPDKQPDKMRMLYDRYNQALRNLAETNRIACFDVATAFDRLHNHRRGQLFCDTCHMLKEGYVEMGRIIARQITAREPK
jgi:lysophospholipase L1-like esterase